MSNGNTLPISDEDWIAAAYACGGIVQDIAMLLKCDRATVFRKKRDNVWLQEAFDDAIQINLDIAESTVIKLLLSGEPKTTRWYLDRKGQERGFGNKIKVDADVNQAGQVHVYIPDNGRDTPTESTNGDTT